MRACLGRRCSRRRVEHAVMPESVFLRVAKRNMPPDAIAVCCHRGRQRGRPRRSSLRCNAVRISGVLRHPLLGVISFAHGPRGRVPEWARPKPLMPPPQRRRRRRNVPGSCVQTWHAIARIVRRHMGSCGLDQLRSRLGGRRSRRVPFEPNAAHVVCVDTRQLGGYFVCGGADLYVRNKPSC